MLTIDLSAIPNQTVSVQLDSGYYELTFMEANGCMCVTITRDGVIILQGERIVAGTPLLPYSYLEAGNFLILTINDEMPDWQSFGVNQTLIYASADELEAL